MASIEATGKASLVVKETLTTSVGADAIDSIVQHQGIQTDSLTASTTVPVTTVVDVTHTLSGGALTVDLTSLTGTNGSSVTASGLKLQYMYIECPSTNTDAVTFTQGAVNGYSIDSAAAAWLIPVQPGGWAMIYAVNLAQDVGASDLGIDLAGTGSETANVIYVFG